MRPLIFLLPFQSASTQFWFKFSAQHISFAFLDLFQRRTDLHCSVLKSALRVYVGADFISAPERVSAFSELFSGKKVYAGAGVNSALCWYKLGADLDSETMMERSGTGNNSEKR